MELGLGILESSVLFLFSFLSPPSLLQICGCYFFGRSASLNLCQNVCGEGKMVVSVCDPDAAT